ncbi:Dolichyl-phosphate-mannose--protein mannosyltransferase 4 [Podosphaera aphanis]|nr:Dolichyl-phosphate-mannose--protein mannosyltransferase 4 [Podosphaera aphanis]
MHSRSSSVQKRKQSSTVIKPESLKSTEPVGACQADKRELSNPEEHASKSEWDYRIALSLITILAFITRFWGISHPNEVVFDEVHFGKFASYYLERTYFFDVHPPFGKLLFALMGWFVGYDGRFHFENIGDSYVTNKVPYVAYRALPALLGALTVPVVFDIMWESGYTLPACILSACLILFDNAHIGQTRLILLDATLVFAMSCSLLCYVKFYKLRHEPFGRRWWKWLLLTGFSLSCVISTKYVGLFAFVTIGSAVAIDLWGLLDIKRRQGALSLPEFARHFAARALALIFVPFLFYLLWFQVHFAILSRSGPGDDFMSPEFQETLSDNVMTANAVTIEYYDHIQIKHKETESYLHSHPDRYPLRYEDGRISSQGQQVTGYPFSDANNHWQILPLDAEKTLERPVKNNEIVRLRHIMTNTMLLSHDVASPYYPTNQEFTTVSIEEALNNRFNDTLFEIKIEHGKSGQELKSFSGQFKLVHYPSKVSMWTHTTPLPDWGHKQQEINGNKNIAQSSNIWFVDAIPSIPPESARLVKQERIVKSLPFLRKWFELQRAMFFHNNALTSSHPYASEPFVWPLLLRGVSFWTNSDTRQQIYFLGNPIGWWLASCLLAVYAGIIGADQLSLRRGIDSLDARTRLRLYNSTGFFFLAWATHYLPFYLMGRQLFLHHYLPAHLASSLVTGALLEFIFNADPGKDDAWKSMNEEKPIAIKSTPARIKLTDQNLLLSWAALGVILVLVVSGWYFFLPLTYGYPGLSVPEVQARKWLNYDLHFAK